MRLHICNLIVVEMQKFLGLHTRMEHEFEVLMTKIAIRGVYTLMLMLLIVSHYYCNDSLTFLLGPTLWGSVSKPTWGYQAGSDTICNDPKKSVIHICSIL